MRRLTDPQIKKMVGTRFLHVLGPDDTISATIVAFDPKVGFTAIADEGFISSGGTSYADQVDKNGNLCVIGVPYDHFEFYDRVSKYCRQIRDTGMMRVTSPGHVGNPSCSF